eukprot:jgi/Psemu1/310821/fgenesh1_kg.685_\
MVWFPSKNPTSRSPSASRSVTRLLALRQEVWGAGWLVANFPAQHANESPPTTPETKPQRSPSAPTGRISCLRVWY